MIFDRDEYELSFIQNAIQRSNDRRVLEKRTLLRGIDVQFDRCHRARFVLIDRRLTISRAQITRTRVHVDSID